MESEPTAPGDGEGELAAPGGWAARDLREVVEVALERAGGLLTAGEDRVARQLLALGTDALELYARLTARVGPVFRVSRLTYAMDIPAAVDELVEAGLVHTVIPADRCLSAFDLVGLRAACERLGLPTRGRRAEVEDRLRGRSWVDEPVVLPRHLGLVARLELLCFERPWMDRQSLVLERLGAVRWAEHPVTGGPPLFRRRAALRAWERARAGDWADGQEALRIAAAGPSGDGGRLDGWRYAVEAVRSVAGDAATLEVLDRAGAAVAQPLALALEREGRAEEALAVCRSGVRGERATSDPAERLALDRTGARLARKLRRSWPPMALTAAPERVLRLPRVAPSRAGGRPRWTVAERDLPVEAAVIEVLRATGREAVWSENHLWTSLFALCFADLYFLPIPGVLPTPRRDGPVDVGTPAFAQRRAPQILQRLDELRDGAGETLVNRWSGERLAGLSAPQMALAVGPRLPGPLLAAILARLAREGWSVANGLPDLCVLPGPPVRAGGLLPAQLDGDAILVEVKGEGDALRDGQRAWHHALLEARISVECWWVRPLQ